MNISAERLAEIQNIPDKDIDTSDIPELDAHFWESASLRDATKLFYLTQSRKGAKKSLRET